MKHPRVLIKIADERITVAEAARRTGISMTAIWDRLRRGVPRDELLKPGYGPRKIEKIVSEHGSPIRAAIDGALAPDEYLQAEEMRGRLT